MKMKIILQAKGSLFYVEKWHTGHYSKGGGSLFYFTRSPHFRQNCVLIGSCHLNTWKTLGKEESFLSSASMKNSRFSSTCIVDKLFSACVFKWSICSRFFSSAVKFKGIFIIPATSPLCQVRSWIETFELAEFPCNNNPSFFRY